MAHSKPNLPSKNCIVCNLPFNWRKKWKKDWDNVKYCSERCRRQQKQAEDSDKNKRPL